MSNQPSNSNIIKTSVSNIDIFVIAQELDDILKDGYILNIYELADNDIILLKCRTKTGKCNLLIDPKNRINITQFEYPVPQFPSQFMMNLRKGMKGRRISRIYQYNLDRILIIELRSFEGNPWQFVIEFFAGGNYVLVNGDGLIHLARSYKKFKDRDLLAKKPYIFPPSNRVDFFNLSFAAFEEQIKGKSGELVRVFARSFNIGGYLAEEMCMRAQIDKNYDTTKLTDEQIHLLFDKVNEFSLHLKTRQYSPRILLDSQNNPIGFEPMAYNIYNEYNFQLKDKFYEAIDDFFSKLDSERLYAEKMEENTKDLSKSQKIIEKQKKQLEQAKIDRETSLENANLIFQYVSTIENLLNTIMTQKRERKLEWNEIIDRLNQGKEKKIAECVIFSNIFPKEMLVEIIIEGKKYKLNLKKTAIENANAIYNQAKNAKRKIDGAKNAIEETEKKHVQETESQKLSLEYKALLLKRPKAKWYEKFRWFFSSDNFLIVGGRDASTNELLVKKYMKNSDFFFHTETRGAPVCIVQNPDNQQIPDTTITETAIFASCYSSAWKQGWGSTDIYYVKPEQVSKSPKAGEYLSKGSFYITGKKNILPHPFLEIAIGIVLEPIKGEEVQEEPDVQETEEEMEEPDVQETEEEMEEPDVQETEEEMEEPDVQETEESREEQDVQETEEDSNESISKADEKKPIGTSPKSHTEVSGATLFYPKIISAPKNTILKYTNNYICIRPSRDGIKSSDLAKKILHQFISQGDESQKKWIRAVSVNDIIRVIPAGNSEIIEK